MTLLLAATVQQRIGLFTAAFIVLAWAVYVFVTARLRHEGEPPGAEIELAPNRRPYFDDDALEGPRLERALGWGLLLLVICAVGPLVYWLHEPTRQEQKTATFLDESIARGKSLFQPADTPGPGHFGCAGCHGSVGQGGSTNYTITDYLGRTRSVTWVAPALNTAAYRFAYPTKADPNAIELRTIIEYGRANTPMPAWGTKGGGPMNDQQLDDLVNYVVSLKLPVEKAQQVARDDAIAQAKADGLVPDGTADTSLYDYVTGKVLFEGFCARCHTKGWSFGEPDVMGGGAFGPNLTGGDTLRQFPNRQDMVDFVGKGSEPYKPYGARGIGHPAGGGMPGFSGQLTAQQIAAIVDYERGL